MAIGFSLHVGVASVDPRFHTGQKPALGCDRAAEEMRNLADRLGYTHTRLLLNEQATRGAFKAEFRSMAAQLAPDDILFVSVACHGVEHVNALDPDEAQDQALLLYDGKLVDDEVYELLKGIAVAARVIVVAEACYSGTLTEKLADVPEAPQGGARSALVEPAVTSAAYRRNVALFREHALTFAKERQKVTANVLLLAAAADTTVAIGLVPDAAGVPPFSTALLAEVDQASSYHDLHRRISERAADVSEPFSTPVLNQNLMTDPNFVQQRPFTIR